MSNLEVSGRFNAQPTLTEEVEAPMPSLSLRDFLRILRRRRAIAINVFVLVVALGVISSLMSKPVFQAGAKVLVQGQSNVMSIAQGNDPLASVFQTSSGRNVETQVELLRSPMSLNKAYKEAGIAPGSAWVDVTRVGSTDVIQLTATSNSREAAESFIKALPRVYERDARENRLREVTESLNFAQKSMEEESAKLRRTEVALGEFRKRWKVVDPEAQATQEIEASGDTQAGVRAAEAEVASLTAQLAALQRERNRISPLTSTQTTTPNPQVPALREKLAELQSERKRLLFLYKENDDEVKKVDAQIADVQSRLATTPATVTNVTRTSNAALAEQDQKIADARAALQAASATLSTVRARSQQLGSNLSRFTELQRQQAQLQRDLATSAGALETLTDSVMQLTLRKKALEAEESPVTTIEAGGPASQIAPRPARNIMLAVALGLLLACAAAMLQESLDDHVRDEEEVRRLLETPVLGYFPLQSVQEGRPLLDLNKPDLQLLEHFRVLRSNVQFTLVGMSGKCLQVTSTLPGEGKSYTASNLAVVMALDGRRVILVDTDLHKMRMHKVFDVPQTPGLTDILVGQAAFEDALHETGVANLRLLSAGTLPPNPVELLNSPAMDAILDRLRREADVVIFDSPPVLATADAQVLASKLDGVLYVMQLGRIPRSAVQRSFELLKQARAHIIGVVFNQIEEKSSQSSYTGYGSYNYGEYGREALESGELVKNSLANGSPDIDAQNDSETPFDALQSKDAKSSIASDAVVAGDVVVAETENQVKTQPHALSGHLQQRSDERST